MHLRVTPPLDPGFAPLSVAWRAFHDAREKTAQARTTLAVERSRGQISTFDMLMYPDGTGHDRENYAMAERVAKTLL